MAIQLLDRNKHNRPLSEVHVSRIARQIIAGKWEFNGDTIKIAKTGDVLDGQHRLWAVIEAKQPIETILVDGIERSAFSTIDTVRRLRTGSDIVALNGQLRHRQIIASALTWLVRWQRGCLEDFRASHNKIENSDIEEAFDAHGKGMARSVDRCRSLRGLANQSLMSFLYYVLANRNLDLAERMISTMENPAGVSIDDPFFRFRSWIAADYSRRKEPLMVIALAIKAATAANAGRSIKLLSWKNQGARAEAFPTLEV